MRKLKAYTYDDMLDGVANVDIEYYPKSEVDAAIAELKDENLRLKRALWLAKADRAKDNSILLPSKFMRNVWDNVERKCRAKAEEYK